MVFNTCYRHTLQIVITICVYAFLFLLITSMFFSFSSTFTKRLFITRVFREIWQKKMIVHSLSDKLKVMSNMFRSCSTVSPLIVLVAAFLIKFRLTINFFAFCQMCSFRTRLLAKLCLQNTFIIFVNESKII